MTDRTPFVSLEEVMTDTGLTKRMIRFDVANGYLPGEIDHRNVVRIRRPEYERWLAGNRGPVGIVRLEDTKERSA